MNKEEKRNVKMLKKQTKRGGSLYGTMYKLSKKQDYEITMSNWELHLIELILMINDIKETEYLYISPYGAILDTIDFNKRFKDLSKLEWDEVPASIDDIRFRGRFATLVIFWILDNTRSLCKKINRMADKKSSKKIQRRILKQVLAKTDMFITNFLYEDLLYGDSMEGIIDMALLGTKLSRRPKLMENFLTQKAFIKDSLSSNDYEEWLLWDSVIKLSYMMATNSTNFKYIMKIDKELIDEPSYIKEILGRLGLAILIKRNDNSDKPVLYKFFTKSEPLIRTIYIDTEEHQELAVGIKAVNFLSFLIDDPLFSEWVYKRV